MKRNRNRALSALLLLLLALAPGCKKQEQQPAPPPEPKKAEAPKPGKPGVPVQKPLSSAGGQAAGRLDFGRKTDPFKPFTPAAPAPAPGPSAQAAPKPAGEQLPIQSFEVGKFRLVGIIAGINQNRALLIDPTGKGYVVQEGMEIGTSQGRITRITASSVEVVESFKADNGRIKKRKIVLTLAKKR